MLQHTYNLQQWLRNALSDFCLSKKNPEHLQRSFGQKDWIWELARYEKGYLPEDINAIHWYLYWLHDILWKCTYTGKVIYLISLYEYIYICSFFDSYHSSTTNGPRPSSGAEPTDLAGRWRVTGGCVWHVGWYLIVGLNGLDLLYFTQI